MSKLFLLISLMGLFSISAVALTGEDKIKNDCLKSAGSYGGDDLNSPYQKCLRAHGVIRVNRNLNSNDTSKGDARVCDFRNPICKSCIDKYGSGDVASARTLITACVQSETSRQKTTTTRLKQQSTPVAEIVVNAPTRQCGKEFPAACKTADTCATANGVWSGTACAIAPCPLGTTPDLNTGLGNTCKCDSEPTIAIERGAGQVCPNSCTQENRQVYNRTTRKCDCIDGFEDRSGLGVCVAEVTPAAATSVAACIQELQDKVNSCNSAATAAVNKCDADKKSTSGDTISMMQSLLQGATVAAGAVDSCSNAAIAGSTGYYALEELRDKCDSDIESCKSSCTDATSYINANKERVYRACRFKDYDHFSCRADSPYPEALTENEFNARWDADHKSSYDQKIQEMLTSITENNSKCQSSSGTAVTNRERMSGYMDQANNAVRAANQCQCQLTSGGGDCAKAPGPAECAADPSLVGCAQATVNCFSATDTSPKCVCFKNPNSAECKNVAQSLQTAASNVSAFAGVKPTGPQSAMTNFGGGDSKPAADVSGDLGDLNGGETSAGGDASGTATADNGSPFGAAAATGGVGGGAPSGSGDPGASAQGGDGSEGGDSKGFRGLFETAKGALGNLFKDKKNDKGTYTGSDGITRDANGNPVSSANKWRPRGMVRGIAGNDTELGGKFEDIWKVMNKQYKVQDQKDSFIFGEKN